MFSRITQILPQFITILYLFMLAFGCGVIISLGVLVAPVIFYAHNYISDGTILSQFQSGLIMTEIFIRGGYILTFIAAFVTLYELFAYSSTHSKKRFIIFGGIAVISILLFTLYYTPAVVELQKQGENVLAQSHFNSLHKQSVWVFEIALLSLVGLFASRIMSLGTLRH